MDDENGNSLIMLSADYVMVARNYSEERRAVAKSMGLGTKSDRIGSRLK